MYRTDRLCAGISKNLLLPAVDFAPPRVLLRRLDAHLQRRFVQRPRPFVSSSKWQSEPFAEPAPTRAVHLQDSYPSVPETILSHSTQPQPKPQLPQSCPGCGALTQEVEPESPGYYSRSRRVVKRYLRKQNPSRQQDEFHVVNDIKTAGEEDKSVTDISGLEPNDPSNDMNTVMDVPLCDRCHDLVHNFRGQSIAHPSIEDVADSIAESPFKRNHIYHVVDAADFPMSLIPDIVSKLTLAKPRSQNRRSQHDFSTKPTLSFIITRSDLLGSTKEMVDSMMTYFKSILRQALGSAGKDMRLGNVHLVSAKRGWWTKEIKEEIWKRGGASWMVGKVNVGKSNLFEVLFPKGSGERAPVYAELRNKQVPQEVQHTDHLLEEDQLLPPAQPERPFPILPVVSSLPGTTASPIRLPFGGHKGELIDLPGLARSDLEDYVKQDRKLDLVMNYRPNVEQHILKAGQSLVLGGGLIRITPQLDTGDPSTTLLAYPFVPLKAHVTSTEKATALQQQQRESGVESLLAENAGLHMRSAGLFDLNTDVTKSRAGPLVRSGVQISRMPFSVYATDILVEGLGWVELVCQVRKHRASRPASTIVERSEGANLTPDEYTTTTNLSQDEPDFAPFTQQTFPEKGVSFSFPRVEIFSPNGKHVSQRPCLGAWVSWKEGRGMRDIPKIRRSGQSTRKQRMTVT